MNKRSKQKYVLLVHPESCSVFIELETNWNNGDCKWNDGLVEEIDCYDDLDFAEFDGEKYAKENNCDFSAYKEEQAFSIPEVRSITLSNIGLINLDNKTNVALQFDLKFCGRAFIDRNNQRIDPIKVKEETGNLKLI